MIHIFQFYKKHCRIPKKYYSTEMRQVFQNCNSKIESRVGYVNGKELILPVEKEDLFKSKGISGIILQDIIGYNRPQSKLQTKPIAEENEFTDWLSKQQIELIELQDSELSVFNSQKRKWDFEIFSIQKNDNDEFEIYLNYKANQSYIGEPERNDFMIYVLKKDEAVKISINGKSDFSMTGRRERSYSEYEYIIEYLGEVESVEFRALNKTETVKEVPEKFGKQIDLRKILY